MATVAFGKTSTGNMLAEDVNISIEDGVSNVVFRTVGPNEEKEGGDCLVGKCSSGSSVTVLVSKATGDTENKDVVIDSLIPAVFSANDFVTLCVVRPLISRAGVSGASAVKNEDGVDSDKGLDSVRDNACFVVVVVWFALGKYDENSKGVIMVGLVKNLLVTSVVDVAME
ncbi:UNVERIFIED_CONTAM: hypothetical protein K2H54_059941 [Gekko kuhli]